MSEPTRQEKCADLARKMGWKLAHNGYGLSPDYPAVPQPRALPNPYESADDKDALLAWMAKQERHIQQRFIFAVRDETTDVDLCYELRIMTAPPPVIADAAWLAIQEKK